MTLGSTKCHFNNTYFENVVIFCWKRQLTVILKVFFTLNKVLDIMFAGHSGYSIIYRTSATVVCVITITSIQNCFVRNIYTITTEVR